MEGCKNRFVKSNTIICCAGLTYTIIKDRKVVAVSPDNMERVIKSLPEPDIDLSGLKKGMVLKLK